MGLSCVIAVPGTYLTMERGTLPMLLVRSDDGVARAVVNMYRHRGAPVANVYGRTTGFTCRYHGWSHGRAGDLKIIPDQRNFPCVELQDHGLIPLPLGERQGMIWVKLDSAAEINLDQHLSSMADELEGYDLQNYVHYQN